MIIIVSGLCDTGQRYLMQMLRDGGMSLLTNATEAHHHKQLSDDFSYDPVRRFRRDSSWLKRAGDRVVKMDPEYLNFITPDYKCKVLYVDRSHDSLMKVMLNQLNVLGSHTPESSARLIVNSIRLKSNRLKQWLVQQRNIDQIFINVESLLLFPREQVRRINTFLGGQLNTSKMNAVIEALPPEQVSDMVTDVEDASLAWQEK